MEQYINGQEHIGIPTPSVKDTVAFYKDLGFKVIYETKLGDLDVAFLEQKGMVIETYTSDSPAMKAGSIDHIAINVSDIEACFKIAKERGYRFADDEEITELPFFSNGVRFFKIYGVSDEVVEFSQHL